MTMTITAVGTAHDTCSCCRRKVEQRHLWGIGQGRTVSELDKVDHWKCADCFASKCASPRACQVKACAKVRPDLFVPAVA